MLTFYDHNSIERVIKINNVRHCVISVLSVFITEVKIIRLLDVIVDTSLLTIDRKVGNISVEINILRVGLSRLLCLEKLYTQEGKHEDMKVDT